MRESGSVGAVEPVNSGFDYRAELGRCIHCGLCVQACPTYFLSGNEAESPRGRITLMRAVAEGRLDPVERGDSLRRHLNLCLDCRACEVECPSGVHYGLLLDAGRRKVQADGLQSASTRLLRQAGLRWALPHPGRLRLLARLLWAYQRLGLEGFVRRTGFLPRRLGAMEGLLPPLRWARSRHRCWPAAGASRGRVAFFTGCVQEAFLPHVNTASIELLQRLGLDVEIPSRQTCCGAAQIHSGDLKTARWLARQNVDAFQENDCLAVITNAGGCAATLAEEYSRLLEDDPGYRWKARRFSAKIKEIHQFVTELGTFSPSRPFDAVVAYSDSCHLRNVLRVTEPPRDLLRRIPGVRLAPLKGDYCCGSAGIYNLVQPETADRLLALKIRSIAESNADVVAVGNTGCHLQILRGVREAGLKCRVLHSVEILNLACGGVAPGFDSKADQAAGTTGGSNGR